MRDKRGQTALMYAAKEGCKELVNKLLPHEADMRDHSGKTSLIYAVENGHSHLVSSLASENRLSDKHLQTPYDYAMRLRCTKSVQSLVSILTDTSTLVLSASVCLQFIRNLSPIVSYMLWKSKNTLYAIHAHTLLDTLMSFLFDDLDISLLRSEEEQRCGESLMHLCTINDSFMASSSSFWLRGEARRRYMHRTRTMEISDASHDSVCAVCLDNHPNVVFLPCRHMVVCSACLTSMERHCPYCRKYVCRHFTINEEDILC